MSSSTEQRPLLVAVGDDDAHEAALRYAAARAVSEGRGLRLVHVIPNAIGTGAQGSMLISYEAAELVGAQLVHHAAERARELTDGKVPVETLTRRGSTVEELLELAPEVDRVVLQHRQQSRLTRMFTGSVSVGVAGRSLVPTVSVPGDWQPPNATSSITVGVDGRLGDADLLDHAFALAKSTGATLTLLHAWYLPSMYDDAIVDRAARQEWTNRITHLIEAGLPEWMTEDPSVKIRIDVTHMRPADALVTASRNTDLLVLGRPGSAHHFPHLGALTRTVIRESSCPVEVVPLPDHAG